MVTVRLVILQYHVMVILADLYLLIVEVQLSTFLTYTCYTTRSMCNYRASNVMLLVSIV